MLPEVATSHQLPPACKFFFNQQLVIDTFMGNQIVVVYNWEKNEALCVLSHCSSSRGLGLWKAKADLLL